MDYQDKVQMLSAKVAGFQSEINNYQILLEIRMRDIETIRKNIADLEEKVRPLKEKLEIMMS